MAEDLFRSIRGALTYRLSKYAQLTRESVFYSFHRHDPHVEIAGIRLSLQSDVISPRVFYSMHTEYEEPERILLDRYIAPADRVLEIGAGMGFLAAFALKLKGVQEYALVEGNPALEPLIRENFKLNGLAFDKVVFLNEVVSDSKAEVDFHVAKDFWASSVYNRQQPVSISTKRAISTAKLLDRLPFKPTFLILDIEGAERELEFSNLTGISKFLVELHPGLIGATETAAVITRIIRQGFALIDFRNTAYYFERPAGAM